MNNLLLFLLIILSLDFIFDVLFSRTGKKICTTLSGKDIQDEEYENKRFVYRLIGAAFWLSIYAAIYFVLSK